jgi:predicted NBD/HSP70 family sugar kinase
VQGELSPPSSLAAPGNTPGGWEEYDLKAELPDPTDSPWVPLDAEALLLAELAVAEAIEEDIFARR